MPARRAAHFRSSRSRPTMRLPASPVSGLPCESSTATVLVALPSAVTLTRYLARPAPSSFLPKLNSLAKKPGSSRPAKAGIDVANEVHALGAVAVLDGEAAAVERQADAAPGAVEAVVDLQGRAGPVGEHAGACRRRPAATAARGGDHRLGFLVLGAELDHQARQELGLERRIGGARLPDRGLLALADVLLFHAAVADVDVAAGRRALDPGAELVELAGGDRRSRTPCRSSCG